ncbi:uncharacterized protein LOC122265369 isoform X2 [Penaeus japonicus]|uniref:uncharacterized protein LOC122265369 isoform X2 n=1 Tax=Penaeus japonicus TaxID=27405 RepID=UPI001C70FE42|nr:uncharacterized protein LOC122265369 isoform X2 [Penaeus japonicus]
MHALPGSLTVSVTIAMFILQVSLLPAAIARPQVVAVGVPEQEDQDLPGPRPGCQDQDPECEEFAARKECENNPTYMEVSCARTCGTCAPESPVVGCEDGREECEAWGEQGECETNPAFMNVNCPKTCKACPPLRPEDCVDRHEYCFLGSLLGLCSIRPSFYLIFCGDSCRKFIPACGEVPTSTVRDLCTDQARGVDIDCGRDPTAATVGSPDTRKKRESGTPVSGEKREQNSTVPGGFNGSDELVEWSRNKPIDSGEQFHAANFGSSVFPISSIFSKICKLLSETVSLKIFLESAVEGEKLGKTDNFVLDLNKYMALATTTNYPKGTLCSPEENADDEGISFSGYKMYKSSASQGLEDPPHSRPKRQLSFEGDDTNNTLCTVSFPTNIPLPFATYRIVYVRVDLCRIAIGLIPIFIKEIMPDPEVPEDTTTTVIPPPVITFPSPPSTSPSLSSTPFTSPSPSSTPSTSPSTPPTTPLPPIPSPNVEAQVRAVIPFCTGAGYLSLVQRLQRFVNRNNGRPLSPVAALLASAINYCKYGLGSPEDTVGLVPDPPSNFQIPAGLQILLNDNEAQVSSTPPKRWPGISHPALYLYQGSNIPPPPTQPFPRPPPSVTTIVTVNGTVIYNTTIFGTGADSDDAGTDGTDLASDTPETDENVPTEDSVGDNENENKEDDPDKEESSGPEPVTEESLNDRNSFSCGGALISPFHILTAAHCLLSGRVSQDGTPRFLKWSLPRYCVRIVCLKRNFSSTAVCAQCRAGEERLGVQYQQFSTS